MRAVVSYIQNDWLERFKKEQSGSWNFRPQSVPADRIPLPLA